jgi:chromosome segregation ATPase
MRELQQNLFLVLGLSLCGLCAWQWYDQTVQRSRVNDFALRLAETETELQASTNSLATANHQLAQMDAAMTALLKTNETGATLILSLQSKLTGLEADRSRLTNHLATVNDKLRQACENIEAQQASIRLLIGQREQLVSNLNATVSERNTIVTNYQKAVEKLGRQNRSY